MASFYPCVKNHASGYTFYISLVSQANTKIMQASPTLAAGDVKIAIDDGAPANLDTLPVVDADFTKRVKVVLSQANTNGDNITLIFSDAAGAEWCDLTINIQTVPRRFDDLAFPATSGRSMVVDAAGLVDSNVVKLGPSGAGTAQTARDVGGNVDTTTSSRMATYTQPTGFLAATFPTGTVANQTNITGGTITTVTNLTNAATAGDLTATMKASITAAVPTADQNGTDAASKILVTPANKLATDASGYVTEVSVDGIKKNTALNNFEYLMVDSADHVTGKTGLTVTAERSIDGGAFAACANSSVEVGAGIYKINLANTDLNGDVITIKLTAIGADARFVTVKTNT